MAKSERDYKNILISKGISYYILKKAKAKGITYKEILQHYNSCKSEKWKKNTEEWLKSIL